MTKFKSGDRVYWVPSWSKYFDPNYSGTLLSYNPSGTWTVHWDDGEDTGNQQFDEDEFYHFENAAHEYAKRNGMLQ